MDGKSGDLSTKNEPAITDASMPCPYGTPALLRSRARKQAAIEVIACMHSTIVPRPRPVRERVIPPWGTNLPPPHHRESRRVAIFVHRFLRLGWWHLKPMWISIRDGSPVSAITLGTACQGHFLRLLSVRNHVDDFRRKQHEVQHPPDIRKSDLVFFASLASARDASLSAREKQLRNPA